MATVGTLTTPANGTAAMNDWLNSALTAGCVVSQWSDATTLTPGVALTTNPYGGTGSGAGNLGNTSAWFEVKAGTGAAAVYWAWKRGADDVTWTWQRGKSGHTTGANATTVGTDATSQTVHSAATFFTTMGRLLCSWEGTDFSFTAFMLPTGGGNIQTLFFDECLASSTFPTSPTADADARVFGKYYNATGLAAGAIRFDGSSTAVAYKRMKHGLGGANNTRCTYGVIRDEFNATTVAPATTSTTGQMGPEPYNSTEVPERISIFIPGAASNASGRIGKPNRHRWATVFASRSNGQFGNDGTNDWVYVAGLMVRWDTSRPTI